MVVHLVAPVTAGSAGLGAVTARLFSQTGMWVVINYNADGIRAQELVLQMRDLSPLPKDEKNFHVIQADLAKRDDIRRLVDQTVAFMGKLDVVFSNGGWTRFRNIEDLDDNVLEED
ncbi:hypothetical protein B7463_g5836, partial [Scytalidium lignicola]